MDKHVKWLFLATTVISILLAALEQFLPKYHQWKKDFPDDEEVQEGELQEEGRLEDPAQSMQFQQQPQPPYNPQYYPPQGYQGGQPLGQQPWQQVYNQFNSQTPNAG